MSEHTADAKALIRRFSYWSAGFGLIPLPFVDVIAITGMQVKMIRDMARLYGLPFSEERAKTLIGAVIGGVVPVSVGTGTAMMLKSVPVIGTIAGVLLVPGLAAASTTAVGRVFLQHFEAGGTLLDFDPERMREYYKEQFELAKTAQSPAPAAVAPAAV